MAKQISEGTQITLDLKTIGILLFTVATVIGMWFTLQADIEEAKTRRISMIAQQARFYAPKNPEATSGPQGESEVPQGSDSDIDRNIAPVPKRKLKTEA